MIGAPGGLSDVLAAHVFPQLTLRDVGAVASTSRHLRDVVRSLVTLLTKLTGITPSAIAQGMHMLDRYLCRLESIPSH